MTYGLTEKEKMSNLQKYNHALFHNMAFFMDVVWEINLETQTIYSMLDRVRPQMVGVESDYADFYESYMENWVHESEQGLFCDFMNPDSLRVLTNDLSLDIRTKNAEGEWQLHRFVITPALDDNGKNKRVYLSSRNIQEEMDAETARLTHSNSELRKTISKEEQFRLASLSGALMVYNINLTRNLIEEEFYEIVDKERYPMLALVNLTAPCNFDEFCRRWSENKIQEESREVFLHMYSRKYLLEAYARGEKEVEIEFDTEIGRGIPITLRNTALMVKDPSSGEIFATVIGKDVSSQREEERRQRETLRDAYDIAMRANTVRSDFLSRMSHEMFTPLNAITGMTSLAREYTTEDRITHCLDAVERAGSTLLNQISGLLDACLMESKSVSLIRHEAIFSEIISEQIAKEQKKAKAKHITLTLDCTKIVHDYVICDIRRIKQLLSCLVDNAVKYTEEGGWVKVAIEELPKRRTAHAHFRLVVEDNGCGILPENQERIFHPFERVEDNRISKHTGSGLGLYIARNIARMAEGDIHVRSVFTEGSTFCADLYIKLQDKSAVKPREQSTGDSGQSFPGRRVLIVEDNDMNAEVAAMLLDALGCETEIVINGREAVERTLAKEPGYYDMILMDIQMPEMNGYEAAQAIRESDRTDLQVLPIVAASANSYPQDVEKSYESGMNGHIAKPLNKSILATAMSQWLT